MKNNLINPSETNLKVVRTEQSSNRPLSDNAFYLMALAGELKKLLGPASLSHFLDTGETVVFSRKAS